METLDNVIRLHLHTAMVESRGKIAIAGALIGVERQRMARLIRRYKVNVKKPVEPWNDPERLETHTHPERLL